MKNKLLSFVIAFSVLFGAGGLAVAVPAYASSTDSAKNAVCQGVSGQTGSNCGTGGNDLNDIISAVLNIISIVAGLVAVIMIIVSGLKYITSGGDANAVSGAKKTLIYAIVGLVIVALSQFIVWFVLDKLNT